MNVAMWGRALRVIPRITKSEWDKLDLIARWLIATRSAVIVMTLIASIIAGLLAWRDGAFDALLWALTTLGLVLAHATNNLVNDLTDHKRGVDQGNYFRTQYGPQPLEHGLMTVREAYRYIVITGALALAVGFYLVSVRGGPVLALLAIGAMFVLFYTWPLKYLGLGEPAVLVVWGPLMVGGTYYVVTGHIDRGVLVASLPFSFGATAVLMGKHIDKLAADAGKKIHTLPVLLGERLARSVTLGLLIGQYVLVVALVVRGYFGPAVLVIALALPTLLLAARAYRHPRPERAPERLPQGVWPLWFVAFAFLHTRRFGALYVLGILSDVAWRALA